MTAASTPSSSTALRASASRVALSERLWANDSETSYVQRPAELRGAELRLLVQAGVLHDHGELCGERSQQCLVPAADVQVVIRVRGQQPDRLASDDQRQRDGSADVGLGGRVLDVGKRAIAFEVVDDHHSPAAVWAEHELEQPLGDDAVRTREVVRSDDLQSRHLEQIDSDATRSHEPRHVLERGREGMVERELCSRLRDDVQQRSCPVEFARCLAGIITRAKRLCRPQRKGRKPGSNQQTVTLPGQTSWSTPTAGSPRRTLTRNVLPICSWTKKRRESSAARAACSADDGSGGESPTEACSRG